MFYSFLPEVEYMNTLCLESELSCIGSVIDRYKFDKVKNTGLLSNEKLLEEVEKKQKALEMKKIEEAITLTPNKIERPNKSSDEKRAAFLESIDDRFEKMPDFIEDEKDGGKVKSTVEAKKIGSAKINEIKSEEISRKNTKN
jgi:hypothetical protein